MKNQERWKPSKFVYRKGKLFASRDQSEVGVGSRLVADLVAEFYDANLRLFAKGNLLDLGCGKVPLYKSYKDFVSDITCVDWQNTMHKNEFLDFEWDISVALPFSDGEFDTIILSDVLEHTPQPELLWNEMARILSRNGKILMNVPFYYPIHEAPHDYYRYTEFALRRFVENAGLELALIERLGGAPEILTDIVAKNILAIPVLGRGTAIFIQYIIYHLLKTNLGKKISNQSSLVFPLGYFLVVEKATCS